MRGPGFFNEGFRIRKTLCKSIDKTLLKSIYKRAYKSSSRKVIFARRRKVRFEDFARAKLSVSIKLSLCILFFRSGTMIASSGLVQSFRNSNPVTRRCQVCRTMCGRQVVG
jgi:hypothetical protein